MYANAVPNAAFLVAQKGREPEEGKPKGTKGNLRKGHQREPKTREPKGNPRREPKEQMTTFRTEFETANRTI